MSSDTAATPGVRADSRLPLLLQRRFGPLTASFAMGAFTDNMLKQVLIIGIPYGVLTIPFLTREAAGPVLGACYPLGIFLFSPLAGQIADRFSKSHLLRAIKLAEAALMMLAAIGFVLKSGAILFFALVAMGAQTAFFNPVRHACMPQLLKPDELVKGNGYANAGLFLSILTAIALGSWMGDTDEGVRTAAIILALVGVGGWLMARLVPALPASDPAIRIRYNPLPQLATMARLVAEAPGVVRPMFGCALFWMQGAAVTVLLPYLIRDVAGADSAVVAVIMALSAVGMALGSVAAGAFVKSRSGFGVAAGGLAAGVGFAVSLYFLNAGLAPSAACVADATACTKLPEFLSSTTGLYIVLAAVGSSTAHALFYTPMIAATQRRATENRRAQIMSAANLLNSGFAIIGAYSMHAFTREGAEAETYFLVTAAAQVAIIAYMAWRKRATPEAESGF